MRAPAERAKSFQQRAIDLMVLAAHTGKPAVTRQYQLIAAAYLKAAEEEVLGVPLDLEFPKSPDAAA